MVTAFGEIPWANLDGPPGDTSALRLIWSVTRESAASQRRVRPSLEVKDERAGDKENDKENHKEIQTQDEAPPCKAQLGQNEKVNGSQATRAMAPGAQTERYWQSEYDGHRTQLVMPYSNLASGEPIPAGLRYALSIGLAIATLLVIGLLSLVVARRLFGSRNVFWWGARAERTVDRHEPGRDDFNAIWKSLSREDQVFLHQLAQGRLGNPANKNSIKRLAEAGLIQFDPWPRIADDRFRDYAQTAEKEEDFDAWELQASKSVWKSIRTPLLVVLLIVVGLLLWLSSSSMQIITTVLAGLASLVGYVTQTASVFRAASGGKG
jgi:hypothetical protein